MKKKKIFSLCLTVSTLVLILSLCVGYLAPENSTIYSLSLSIGGCSVVFFICFWIGKLEAEKDLVFKENLKLTFENQQLTDRINYLEEKYNIKPDFKEMVAHDKES